MDCCFFFKKNNKITFEPRFKRKTNDYVKRAKNRHGKRFSYKKVDYINDHTAIEILCNDCCEYFCMRPEIHIINGRCPNCTPNLNRVKYPLNKK